MHHDLSSPAKSTSHQSIEKPRPKAKRQCAQTLCMRTGTLVTDIVVLMLLAAVFGLVEFVLTPFVVRGYYCDDHTFVGGCLKEITHESVSSTVPSWLMIVVPACVLLVVVLPNEWCTDRSTMPSACYKYVGAYVCGLMATCILTDVIKLTAGMLRPNFVSVCQPSAAIVHLCASNSSAFVSASVLHCTNTDQRAVADARMSFPSGHASLSVYSAAFIIMYIRSRVHWRVFHSTLILRVLELCVACGAVFSAASRIKDNKHHLQDVLCGSLLGAAVSLSMVSSLFGPQQEEKCKWEGYELQGTDQVYAARNEAHRNQVLNPTTHNQTQTGLHRR